MAFRENVSEKCYFSYYDQLDKNGNKTKKQVSDLSVTTTYNLTLNPDNYTNSSQYAAKDFNGIKFEKEYLSSSYKTNYVAKSSPETLKINLSDFTQDQTMSGSSYIIVKGNPIYSSQIIKDANQFIIQRKSHGFPSGEIEINISDYIYSYATFWNVLYEPMSVYVDTVYVKYTNPYCQITWERCDPDIQTVNPGTGSYINAKADTTISVLFEVLTSESGIEYPPTEISLIWGTSSDTLNNTIIGYPTEGNPRSAEIIVNANTFPNKTTVYFKIRYKSAAASEYFESDVYNYITNDVVGTVSNLSPNNATINGEEPHVFTWEYSSSSGLGQTAFDLQISNNNGVSWTDLFTKEISTETKANIPANTFYSGSALWKVRGYNTSDEPSPWSEPANIIVLAPPRPPTIREITNTPKIKISWASGDQQAFQVIANDIDSGVVFGTKNIYYVPYYFKDNTVVNVKIRIKNKFGEWSGWATGTVTVKNIPTGEIDLIVSSDNDSANLNWSSDTEFISFYVLRGGIPIAKTTDLKEYTDYTSVGANEYQIMGITADGYYTLSNVVPVSVFPKTAVIGILSNVVSWVTLTYRRGNLPEIVTSSSENVYYQYYSGRKLPVAYSSRFKTKNKTLNFTVYKQDADAIENMTGQAVVYKDYAENKIIGIVNDVETSSNASRPDVRLEITAIDYLEDVGYD